MARRKIAKLLVANRGEIAVRIVRCAHELGIKTVQVHSDVDEESLAVKLADESVGIGPPQAKKSYLNTGAILEAAQRTGAHAVHPGYGFLAENADFADAVVDAGLVFIGPAGETIRTMGDKSRAREVARKAGVPVVPGSEGKIDDLDKGSEIADAVGYPLLIKAAAGGGGRGIRLVQEGKDFENQALQAVAEAKAAFGDGSFYLERFIRRARHIEVQVLGDGERCVHLFERECSLQRRRQKIWEEAPSTALEPEARARLCADAVRIAEAVGYCSAGTVEFLFDDETGEFYFIEMNTRIQVEHPVSEFITGIDIMREMIRIAEGDELRLSQEEIRQRGHSIEVRINAEDPSASFMPCPGRVEKVIVPGGIGVRFDGMIYPGCGIPPFYDSLLGKLIVWDTDRPGALRRLRRALGELEIEGVKTTKPLFERLVVDPDVESGRVHTGWVENWLEDGTAIQ